ncbi:hypothetical protein [Sphingobium indicum]|nr:hypothetical protein [Sphingobium indicum]
MSGDKQMDRIDHIFCALSQRMSNLSHPGHVMPAPETLSSLIDKVNAAKRRYQPGMDR